MSSTLSKTAVPVRPAQIASPWLNKVSQLPTTSAMVMVRRRWDGRPQTSRIRLGANAPKPLLLLIVDSDRAFGAEDVNPRHDSTTAWA